MEFREFLETNLTPEQWQSVNNYMVRKGYDWRGAEDAKRIIMGIMKDWARRWGRWYITSARN